MPSNFKVDQVDHIELFVPDRHDAAKWYEEVLGLEILKEYEHWAEDPNGPLMISPDGGSTKLALFGGESLRSEEPTGFYLVAFRVSGEGFLKFLDRLDDVPVGDLGGQPITREAVRDNEGAFSIYFSDPYGHRLEVTTYDHDVVAGALGRK